MSFYIGNKRKNSNYPHPTSQSSLLCLAGKWNMHCSYRRVDARIQATGKACGESANEPLNHDNDQLSLLLFISNVCLSYAFYTQGIRRWLMKLLELLKYKVIIQRWKWNSYGQIYTLNHLAEIHGYSTYLVISYVDMMKYLQYYLRGLSFCGGLWTVVCEPQRQDGYIHINILNPLWKRLTSVSRNVIFHSKIRWVFFFY